MDRLGKSATLYDPTPGQQDSLNAPIRGNPAGQSINVIPSTESREDTEISERGGEPESRRDFLVLDTVTLHEHEDDQPASDIEFGGRRYRIVTATDPGDGFHHVHARRLR